MFILKRAGTSKYNINNNEGAKTAKKRNYSEQNSAMGSSITNLSLKGPERHIFSLLRVAFRLEAFSFWRGMTAASTVNRGFLIGLPW